MKCEHLGTIQDIEPQIAAFENALVRKLHKHGTLLQNDLDYFVGGSPRLGREQFQQVVDSLVERNIILRCTTNRKNSFVLSLTPWGEHQAEILETERKQRALQK